MIEKLKRVLKREDTVLFIGSGVSLWSGLPSWTGVIQELIEFIKENGLDASLTEQELKRGDLLQAASYGFDKLTKPLFAQFIRSTTRLGIAQPHEIHHKIIALGANCYITTNYDKLLELSFHRWKPNTYFRTVVNKQLTETAEIVGARANNFLFKLHGDAEDSDSIILTREQYRALNPGGELFPAMETAKILMASRPVVYIGFGLRDPDFLYIRDLLFNTYKGGTRDHYAIMADIGEQEKDYWRRNFGIHLIEYKTISKHDGIRDHTPILELLDELIVSNDDIKISEFVLSPDFILSINRHAAKYIGFEISKIHLPLVVHPIENNYRKRTQYLRYYEASIELLLDNGPKKFILIGLPGGGKSYSLKASVARLSKILSDACIEDSLKINETIIPIYLDLKLYEGNIVKLIEQNIPVGMNLSILCSNFKVKLYLDAFNEIPKEYSETKHWNTDISSLLEKFNLSVVISSRTLDGLSDLELPCFNLDSIDKEFITTSLIQNKFELKGLFENEIIALLQKPFFYKLIIENGFEIDSGTSPQKIYRLLIDQINERLIDRFEVNIDILEPLSSVALTALDNGEEAFKIEILINYIDLEVKKFTGISIASTDIINWLVSQSFLIPLVNERISFFHQSVTEYLAATKLASLFVNNNQILREKLKFRNWDQAIFLCLSLLSKEEAEKFLETVITIDFDLALSAVKYLETDTTNIVERILIEIDSNDSDDWDLQSQISHRLQGSLPITEKHIIILKQLIKKGNMLGGSATGCLIDLLGAEYKNEALNLMVDNCDDFHFCSEVAYKLRRIITEEDVYDILEMCHKVQEKFDKGEIIDSDEFESVLVHLLDGISINKVLSVFYSENLKPEEQSVQINVLCEFLNECINNAGFKICLELLSLGIDKVAFPIHMILLYKKDNTIDHSIIENKHINSLLKIIKKRNNEYAGWALNSLKDIVRERKDLKIIVNKEINKSHGVLKAALYYAISETNEYAIVFSALEDLLIMDHKKLNMQNLSLLSHMRELNWVGQEKLFVELLKLKNIELSRQLCDNLNFRRNNEDELTLDIGPIKWWLEWFNEYINSKKRDIFFSFPISNVIVSHIDKDKRNEFITEFNNPESEYRRVLSQIILVRMTDLKFEDFTQESLSYLFEELKNIVVKSYDSNILSEISTEQFVTEQMLPLYKESQGLQRKNLKILIERVGEDHKRRYLIE